MKHVTRHNWATNQAEENKTKTKRHYNIPRNTVFSKAQPCKVVTSEPIQEVLHKNCFSAAINLVYQVIDCKRIIIRYHPMALFFHLVMDDRQTKLPKQFYLMAMVIIIKLHKPNISSLISKAMFMEGDQFFKLAFLSLFSYHSGMQTGLPFSPSPIYLSVY